jgi:hypothetical protein
MSGAGASAREGITVTSFPQGTVFSVALMPLRNGRHGGARSGAIFRCPEGRVPKPGLHCDSVDGSVLHGQGELVEATGGWSPSRVWARTGREDSGRRGQPVRSLAEDRDERSVGRETDGDRACARAHGRGSRPVCGGCARACVSFCRGTER